MNCLEESTLEQVFKRILTAMYFPTFKFRINKKHFCMYLGPAEVNQGLGFIRLQYIVLPFLFDEKLSIPAKMHFNSFLDCKTVVNNPLIIENNTQTERRLQLRFKGVKINDFISLCICIQQKHFSNKY